MQLYSNKTTMECKQQAEGEKIDKNKSVYRSYQAQLRGRMLLMIFTQIIHSWPSEISFVYHRRNQGEAKGAITS